MTKAKPQDGSKVTGYRTLTEADIECMNRLKNVSRHFCNLISTNQETGADVRWSAIAKTQMQQACMAACRAIAKPDNDC